MASRNTLDMTQGPIFRKLLLFAYPLIISSLIGTLYNATDKVIAGRFIGDNAMAAVGATTSTITLIVNAFVGISVGVSVVCGNYIGGKRQQDLRECMHSAPIAGFLCGLLAGAVGALCCSPLMKATAVPDDVFADAVTYMTLRMVGTPIYISNSFCNSILTAHGDTKRITLAGIISGLLNVLGNILFVVVIPMGIAGIAWATVLSQLFAFGVKIVVLFSPRDVYQLKFRELRLHGQHVKRIFLSGIPNGLNKVVFSFSNTLLQTCVNGFGATLIAGNAVTDTVFDLVCLFPIQMDSACGCAVAQCFGAKKYERIEQVVKKGILSCVIMVAGMATVLTLTGPAVMRLFTEDPAVAAAGVPKLLFSCWGYIIYSFALVYASALRGIRKSGTMLVLNICGVCLPRVIWVWCVFPFFATPNMLYLIYPISYAISAILLGAAYHREHRKLMTV